MLRGKGSSRPRPTGEMVFAPEWRPEAEEEVVRLYDGDGAAVSGLDLELEWSNSSQHQILLAGKT